MFDSLVESGSHKDDLARKGSFLLGTFVLYVVVLLGVSVLSIYLYNSNLPDASLELVTLVAPVPQAPEPEAKPEQKQEQKPEAAKNEPQVSMRQEISVIAPVVKTQEVASAKTREVARDVPVVLGNRDVDAAPSAAPVGPIGPNVGGGGGGGTAVGPVVADTGDAPPPPPKPTPPPKPKTVVSGGVLNGKAISKPAPSYPAIAKQARASGSVTVQITVDEGGRVISANAVSGHPLLQQAAVSAVRNWRFTPTLLSGQPVKVTGQVIVTFTLQ
ncbi:MAG TPA: TonB family protein [Pyrinomonadaceae bacterium]|nr:TonB family protein [Pyrinomonadaceae bacterium]